MEALLSLKDLSLRTTQKNILNNISFDIFPHQTLALLGETGSGKSLTALSILQLLHSAFRISPKTEIVFEGQDLLGLSERQMCGIRGAKIAMIFQEPMTALNPVLTIGQQITEVLKLHRRLSRSARRSEIYKLLETVQIQAVERVYRAYPHQLSGGMKQRAMIAMALAGAPKLLIADEPTTSLDVITQAQIIALLKQLQAQYGMAILFISHDIAVAAQIADRIAILNKGELVEQGLVDQVLSSPTQLYTQKLLSAIPTLSKAPVIEHTEVVLSVEDLDIAFPIKGGIFNRSIGRVQAVQNVNLNLGTGETLAIVGESGSGKTTLAKAVLALIPPTRGIIRVLGERLSTLKDSQLRRKRQHFQMIFQDPVSAMDPRLRVQEIIEEGMLALGIGADQAERDAKIDLLLEQVGLLKEHKIRYPHQLSGGQAQRVCIARALALGPQLLVCDEPTSSLDVSVQAQILDLFIRLQQELGLSYLFISHNFAVVRAIAHRVAVMKDGKIVEQGSVEQVLHAPTHPYTQALLGAVPKFLKSHNSRSIN